MSIVLIGNYPPDKQESMERFALMLATGFRSAGLETEIWRPVSVLAVGAKSTTYGLGKWLGYVDKWLIFPLILLWRLYTNSNKAGRHFHICDHSNSPYFKYLPKARTTITCHDVLAIRGALGYEDAFCSATPFGKIYQKWILGNLSRFNSLAAVSELTLNHLKELDKAKGKPKEWKVIHNAFNSHFSQLPLAEAKPLLKNAGLNPDVPFILHVGSGLPRKNRKLLIDMVAYAGNEWRGNICFAGEAPDEDLAKYAADHNLAERLISIVKPDHATLLALYSTCEAFIFPSFSEGFGWPLIEAQACGAPVISSNIQPMPEVSGGAALHADPLNAREFADALLSLKNEIRRKELIRLGFENCQRFEPVRMINSYLNLMKLDVNQ